MVSPAFTIWPCSCYRFLPNRKRRLRGNNLRHYLALIAVEGVNGVTRATG